MAYKNLQMRRDTAANWTSNNPTLLSGEMGYETDTYKIKIGDGSTVWTSLSYFDSSGGVQVLDTNTITSSTDAADVSACNILLVNATGGDIVIGGFSGGVDHQIVYVFKYIATNRLTMEHEEATGTQKLRNDAGGDIAFSDGIYGNIAYICKDDKWHQLAYLSST